MEGIHGQDDHGRRQHRDWRVRLGSRHGHRSAQALLETRLEDAFRQQRRWIGYRRGLEGVSGREHVVHRREQDVYHPGDHDERGER